MLLYNVVYTRIYIEHWHWPYHWFGKAFVQLRNLSFFRLLKWRTEGDPIKLKWPKLILVRKIQYYILTGINSLKICLFELNLIWGHNLETNDKIKRTDMERMKKMKNKKNSDTITAKWSNNLLEIVFLCIYT